MGLALALDKEPELAAPTDLVSVPPLLVELAGPARDDAGYLSTNPGTFLQAVHLAERFPESATALSRLSAAALIEGDTDLAQASATSAIRFALTEGDEPALISAAQVLAILGHTDSAADAMRQIGGTGPARLAYAQVLAAQRDFEAALEAVGESEDIGARALRGWIRLEQGEYVEAIRELRGALAHGAPQVDVLTNLGYAYAALGEREKAYRSTRQALHLAPTSRVVALNLVAYQFAAGEFASALTSLLAIRKHYPEDIMLFAAVAEARLRLGDAKSALRELRSARDRLEKLDVSVRKRAEILANTAFMEWRLGKRSTENAVESIRKELLRCNFESLDIGRMLARLLTGISQLSQLETLYKGLADVHPRHALYELEAQLAFGRGEFGKALVAAKRWSREEPFDPAAAVTVTYLLSEVDGKYEESARFGEDALKRVPSSALLRNNVAFGWAMAGKPQRAMRLLSGVSEVPYTLATRGLVKLSMGDIAGGSADYERAASIAEKEKGAELATLIRLRRVLALLELGYEADEDPRHLVEELNESDNPIAIVVRRQVKQLT